MSTRIVAIRPTVQEVEELDVLAQQQPFHTTRSQVALQMLRDGLAQHRATKGVKPKPTKKR